MYLFLKAPPFVFPELGMLCFLKENISFPSSGIQGKHSCFGPWVPGQTPLKFAMQIKRS